VLSTANLSQFVGSGPIARDLCHLGRCSGDGLPRRRRSCCSSDNSERAAGPRRRFTGHGIAFRLQHSSRFGMAALRRLRSYRTEGSRPQQRRGSSWRVGGYRCSLDAWVRSNPTPSSFRPLHEPCTCRPESPAHPILRARKSESARDADSVGRGREGRRRTILSGRKPEGKPFNRLPCFVI
jgi:hypothetical protein